MRISADVDLFGMTIGSSASSKSAILGTLPCARFLEKPPVAREEPFGEGVFPSKI